MTAEVRVHALAYGGSFVGEVVRGPEESVGKRVFVPFAAPGELVTIGVLKEEKRFIEGKLTDIIERSPSRIDPVCPYFGTCGGCDLQHLPISEQRELKRRMIESTLARQGGIRPTRGVSTTSTSLPEYGYRRRATLHINVAGELGFYRSGTGEVIPVDHCPIASRSINEGITVLQPFLPILREELGAVAIEESETGEISLLFLPRDGIKPRTPLPEELVRRIPRASVRGGTQPDEDGTGHFSQVNAAANAELIRLVLERMTEEVVTDLYAGSGNFSIPLATAGRSVTAVELDPTLAALGMKAATANSLTPRLRFVQSSCEQYLKSNHPAASVLLDPPRSGAKEIVKRLEPQRTRLIVYVSCNLPSLTRDLQTLSARGYEIVETIFVDMFPQTHHVETVTSIVARS